MRSQLMVGTLCAVVIMFSGCCSQTRLGARAGLASHRPLQSIAQQRGGIGGCQACDLLAERRALRGSGQLGLGLAGGCDGSAGCLAASRAARLDRRASRVGLPGGALDSQAFAAEAFDQGGGILPVGGQVFGGRVAHAGGGLAAGLGGGGLGGGGLGGAVGCGRVGCGFRGKPCASCIAAARARRGSGIGGNLRPYGGTIPHTNTPPTFNGGPSGGGVPQYTYPYYTTRGPRDFLNPNPGSIGP